MPDIPSRPPRSDSGSPSPDKKKPRHTEGLPKPNFRSKDTSSTTGAQNETSSGKDAIGETSDSPEKVKAEIDKNRKNAA